MAEPYLTLSANDRLEALGVVATASGRPVHLLEKDIWVVWALQGLFESKLGEHLVFKGGTSLSKGYGIIRRFSEDIDLTYDVRQIIPELAKGDPPIPESRSQADKWTKAARERLTIWVKDEALPILEKHAVATGVSVKFRVEDDVIYVDYEQLSEGSEYVAPSVKLEFGARSTGEPAEVRQVACDAAPSLPELQFPTAAPKIMLPQRTFWEKATAVHVLCAQGIKGDRISRHWHDLVRLDDAGYAQAAFDDKALAKEVADWKSKFFRVKDRDGNVIDYHAAVSGKLQLVPDQDMRAELEADYQKMIDAGLLLDDAEPFAELMTRCETLQKRANGQV
ncbi:nucleotidyl transferase AbiEii/AbiGii toxin family protein [Bradyrhizobium barranii]|uniref:Nucleotidyl transferase AbiEii/AbiGii toxin family protein n=1 Tax=Bradyrhizobium barranii TaxID=2992140 RepID=A0ABY3QWR8_9BRAD|nr:nucleotidyl transferase AbiEii/AbiGii toxin family protein [Bradyrhizobium japonicum]UFW90479.1 nucleotidyl transferase AbiEii/AbiGii toxin family protein [Bradyrhizobium japonicum]